MKILRARFQNFRLLRDINLDFSTNPDKPLTVIRAENESGKTTILIGLQWGLYGDDALPGKASEFRLHPLDWDVPGKPVPISIELDLEITRSRVNRAGKQVVSKKYYQVVRVAHETPKGSSWERSPSTMRLFELTERGNEPVDYAERELAQEWPPELREIFFTDGDRALTFIEADTSTKRANVQKAIRSLLGLGIVETTLRHIDNTSRSINRKAKDAGAGGELENVASELERVNDDIEQHQKALAIAQEKNEAYSTRIEELDKQISDVLIKGDKRDLDRRLTAVRQRYAQATKDMDVATKKHSDLFNGMELSRDIMGEPLQQIIDSLDELRQRGHFPKTHIPILKEHLKAEECICGASLAAHDKDAEARRQHINGLITQSQEADDLNQALTDLYYASATFRTPRAGERWLNWYDSVANERDQAEERSKEAGKEQRALEAQIARLDDVDVSGLQEEKRNYENLLRNSHASYTRSETEISHLQRNRQVLLNQQQSLLKQAKTGALILAKSYMAQDVQNVLRRALERITNEELAKVSNLMNNYFIEMIGADPEQKSLIRRAEVSKDFDILVHGANDRPLNPDNDLNGASRRALTMAFILALTKVSEVEAPNIIDTPLGMMSGFVKRSVLQIAIRQSSQLTLFLTRSEIAGCEDILDAEAGKVFTLTNTSHYPRMLEHEPTETTVCAVRCECDHRRQCVVCQRRDDAI